MVYKCKENNEKPRKSLHLHRQKRRKRIYIAKAGQISLFEEPANFIGEKLNPENRWVQMAAMIPWDLLCEKHKEQLQNKKVGNTAKAARMALGAHIIKEKFKLSDEEAVEHIKESPYLQWFQGMPGFSDLAPFDATTWTKAIQEEPAAARRNRRQRTRARCF